MHSTKFRPTISSAAIRSGSWFHFIFTVADVNRLVEAASLLGPPGALRRHTYSTIFAVLSVTGMRISEALNLQFEDVTADGLTLILETAFATAEENQGSGRDMEIWLPSLDTFRDQLART